MAALRRSTATTERHVHQRDEGGGLEEPPSYGAIGIALGDYDKDGRLDILINGRDNAPNRLYHNDGNWRFTEVAKKAGILQPPHNGFVCFLFDYNNDGWPDILTTQSCALGSSCGRPEERSTLRERQHADASRLFRNNGNGTFTDVTLSSRSSSIPPEPWARA